MSEAAVLMDSQWQPRAARLALAAAAVSLALGAAASWFGIAMESAALWGFGAACLFFLPTSLSLHGRIRHGLGNRGLEGERLTLRIVSHLLRLLAVAMVVAGAFEITGPVVMQLHPESLWLAVTALGLITMLWLAKRTLAGAHPTLGLDAGRTRTLVELAALLMAGTLLGRWFPWGGALGCLVMALRLFLEGNVLAKGSALSAACGGCGSGCGCG